MTRSAMEIIPIITKIAKLLINITVLGLYRWGDEGYFMGASYNKNHDAEALTSGIFVGFIIYNIVSLLSTCFDSNSVAHSITEILMNLAGFALWMIVGVVTLQFWERFEPELHFRESVNPRKAGLSMGSWAVINAPIYGLEAVINFMIYRNSDH